MTIKTLNDIPAIAQYLQRIGAEPRSLRTAVVRENRGAYWKDIAVISFTREGAVKATEEYAPTSVEADMIKAHCLAAKWPEHVRITNLVNLPSELKNADKKDLYIFRDERNEIVMVQQRIENKQGGKAYVPWTYWDDGSWRRMEPEGKLPFWGIEQLKTNAVVFIHEGAKAARAISEAVANGSIKDHPWGEELQNAAHIGWIGGALSPYRTDWSALKRMNVRKAYIVSDNDSAGRKAVPSIAYQLRVPTFQLQFTNEWPVSFDLADEFPDNMFRTIDSTRHYVGPSFRSCLHPATWATDLIPSKKGKPTIVLRDEFREMWSYIEDADLFVCNDMPEILRTEQVLNKMLAPFSHSSNTANLIVKNYEGRSTSLCYRPDIKGRFVTDKTTSAINLHTPSQVKSKKGNPQPWLDFLDYMFPVEAERNEVKKWCATLVARPGVRMEYGLLLVSETQGIGKTTLGAKILAPLVGAQNAGFPTEEDIVNSAFNGWLANKRLIVIGEIYSGHSWKAYNKLKSYITDKDVEVNQKYMRTYRVENWAHILASSNSRKALKMEESDRRWFYPEVIERPWSNQKFEDFHNWLNSGGLQIIRWWCDNYGSYAAAGQRAPMTDLKKRMIDESRSDAAREMIDFCEAVVNDDEEVTFAMKEVMAYLKSATEGKVFDTQHEMKKLAVERGFKVLPKRLRVGSTMQYVIASPAFVSKIGSEKLLKVDEPSAESAKILDEVRSKMKNPIAVNQAGM